MKINELSIENIVVGTGAAGLQAALRLYQNGETDLAVVAENINAGTSRNTGSDKQTCIINQNINSAKMLQRFFYKHFPAFRIINRALHIMTVQPKFS